MRFTQVNPAKTVIKQVSNLQRHLQPIPLALLLVNVALNISWPILHGPDRTLVTILGVLTFFCESTIHAFVTRGLQYTRTFLAIVLPSAFIAEAIGVHTHLPFGDYSYSAKLGWMFLQVPTLIPLAWFMMMYPCWLIAGSLTNRSALRIAIASWLMASWDLFLDPQMVGEGFWNWHSPTGAKTTSIPLSNFFGWLIVAAILYTLLTRLLPTPEQINFDDRVPQLAVAWVWLGSFVANIGWFAPFLNQPGTALSGLIGMGIVLVPYYLKILRMPQPIGEPL